VLPLLRCSHARATDTRRRGKRATGRAARCQPPPSAARARRPPPATARAEQNRTAALRRMESDAAAGHRRAGPVDPLGGDRPTFMQSITAGRQQRRCDPFPADCCAPGLHMAAARLPFLPAARARRCRRWGRPRPLLGMRDHLRGTRLAPPCLLPSAAVGRTGRRAGAGRSLQEDVRQSTLEQSRHMEEELR
jgi:hypothetical protein